MAERSLVGAARLGALGSLVAAGLGLSGCGTWFGESETILPGERIALREAVAQSEGISGAATFSTAHSVSSWPQAGGAPNRSIGNAEGTISLTKVWSVSIGAGSDSESRITAPPVAADGRIYALDAAAQVTAVSEKNGEKIWSVELAPEDEDGRDGFGGGLAAVGDFLVVTTGFGEVIGLRSVNGEEVWRAKMTAPVRAAPTVSEGLALVIAKDGSLTALGVGSGDQRWRVLGLEGGASMMTGGGSSPAISGEIVAAPFASGDISIFRLRDGRQGWSQPLGAARRGSGLSLIADVSSPPVIAGGRIIAGGVSGRLVSFDIPTGRRVWARDLGAYNPVWAAGETVFVVGEDAIVHALSATTGESLWTVALPRYDDPEDRQGAFAYGGPILVGGKLIVVSSDEKIFKLDAATGTLEQEADLPGPATVPPIAVNGRVYVLDDDGDLHAYN